MANYIIDTSFCFNTEINSGYGKNPREVISNLTADIKIAKAAGHNFYIPPRVVDEFLTFLNRDEEPVQTFLAECIVQSPQTAALTVPAAMMYDFVDDIRQRSLQGLNIAEDEVTKASQTILETAPQNKIDFQKTIGTHIQKLRERYRHATRFRFLDSVVDLDIILLAHQLDATVVTADEGVVVWGRKLGVREILPEVFKQQLATQSSQ